MILDQIYIATCLMFFPVPYCFGRFCIFPQFSNRRVDYIGRGLQDLEALNQVMFRLVSVPASHFFFLKSQLLCTTFGLPGKPDYYLFMCYQHFAYVCSFTYSVNDLCFFSLFLKRFCFYLLFLVALGLCCCVWASSSWGGQGLLSSWGRRRLTVVASLNTEHRLWLWASAVAALKDCGSQAVECGWAVMVHRLSCSSARRIF